MAAGPKKPVNIFKLKNLGEPKNVFNWRLWFAVISFGLLGAARGVDEGLIAGAFGSTDFQNTIKLSSYSLVEQTSIKGNVAAMVQLGSIGGALIAFLICDRIGRIWATRQLCILWIVGIAIFMANNGSLAAIYAGRFIAGLGVGQTAVVGPIYIAEIAPASVRGLCTCMFTGFVYLGIVLAYLANFGAQVQLGDATHTRWLAPTSLHIIFATIILAMTVFQYESPRYLVKVGKPEEALLNMSRLRNLNTTDPYLIQEMQSIQATHQQELEETSNTGFFGVLKEMFCVPSNFYRIYLATMAQLMAQWSGAGSITVYATDLFMLLGFNEGNESLLIAVIFGVIKMVAAVCCALFLVDVIGRKRSLMAGITLQAIAMIYVASFLSAVPQLGVATEFVLPKSLVPASYGAIAMVFLSGIGWALGWNSMQYLLTAELFPLRIRAVSTSLAMTVHFTNSFGNSRTLPHMLLPVKNGGLGPAGTFWFFAAVTIVGGAWVWVSVPETAGRDLESMNKLFELPWYKIGRYGNADADRVDRIEVLDGARTPDSTTDTLKRVHAHVVREEKRGNGHSIA
ncbi:MFS quinate transporter [Apiospora arundinis]|uniref:Major facilitator superfamily domain general substrate transporter n=1 Tax=Apiospora arundinis TaxID=335852 RepID=A0ABR2IVX6_9PEZI